MIIPVGLDCKAILEDKLTSTFTDLSKGTYKAAVAANSILTDRFRLYAATPTISAVGDLPLDGQPKAFAVRNIEIRITGEVTPNAVASLYDTNGKLILTRKLDEGSLNVIPTPGFRSGLYVLKVNDKGKVKGFKLMMKEIRNEFKRRGTRRGIAENRKAVNLCGTLRLLSGTLR